MNTQEREEVLTEEKRKETQKLLEAFNSLRSRTDRLVSLAFVLGVASKEEPAPKVTA